jgi:signal transduction histidine kinase
VFDRFYRVDASRTHAFVSQGSGSGLGLSIARWIAELHCGRLELTDASANATVFTLHLPVQPVFSATP